ncbi:predicted protein [Nematostella vectensis]|uniref:Frizzled-4 n=1 Tax=Nematostella vectensis TaxID=45351 RepID=A7SCF4_NEMVE|nr:predicted protein [Nematostella vectensis]|eukprot:XP_001630630.1 predicted protein [Nematostella vectensis]
MGAKRLALILLLFITVSAMVYGQRSEVPNSKCTPITIPLCMGIGYNATRFPNFLAQESQEEAAKRIHEFKPLIAVNCAPLLRFFLCSVFVPMCTKEVNVPIYACRSMCESARDGCSPMMQRFGFNWPDTLDCDRLPKKGDPQAKSDPTKLCMAAPNIKQTAPLNESDIWSNFESLGPEFKKINNTGPLRYKYTYVEKYDQCVPQCKSDLMFSSNNKRFANVWISVWSVLCFISTAVTVLTFVIDTSRFKYPERPIIFLSLCYNLYSLGYIVRVTAGRNEVICDETESFVIRAGMNIADHACCSVVFLLLYYFGMASAVWWVVLTFAWFLAAGRKWGQEAIERKATYFHAVAWTVPAIQTIMALIMRKVDADELTGLCYVGNMDYENLANYVLTPLCLYLLVGTFFLLAGFVSLFRIRTVLKNKETNTDKLEKLIVRIGVFSVLYTIPVSAVIACSFYEYNNMDVWKVRAPFNTYICRGDQACLENYGPSIEVFIVKYFMLLIIGITSNMWIWSTKTFKSWRKFYSKRKGGEAKKKVDYSAGSAPPKNSLQVHMPPPSVQPVYHHTSAFAPIAPSPATRSVGSSPAPNSLTYSKNSGLNPMVTV